MSAPIVILTDKPSLTKALAPHLARHLHCSDVFTLQLLLWGAGRFTYPRGLAWDDYPLTLAPRYRPDPEHWWNVCRLHMDGRLERINADPLRLLAAAKTLILANDTWASGRVAAMATIGLVGALRQPIPAVRLASLWPEDAIADAVARMEETPFDPATDGLLARGEIKRRFDYNWSLNALPILGRTLAAAGIRAPGAALSKNMVQVLYAMAHRPPVKDPTMISLMARWTGSGRYGTGEMGSEATRCSIVDNLARLGLTEEASDKCHGRIVSAAGWELLARLHPNCEDVDQPMRLDAWMQQAVGPDGKRDPDGVAAAVEASDRYLRTWFGRQKRFVAKGARRDVAELRAKAVPLPKPSRSRTPPDSGLPHDLWTLQWEMSKKHRWSAQHTLDVAERLYAKGRISAPRSDGRYAPAVIGTHLAPNLIAALCALPELADDIARAVPDHRSPCWDDAKAARQSENAILPSWLFKGDFSTGLGEDERLLFVAIAHRFLRQFDPDRAPKRAPKT